MSLEKIIDIATWLPRKADNVLEIAHGGIADLAERKGVGDRNFLGATAIAVSYVSTFAGFMPVALKVMGDSMLNLYNSLTSENYSHIPIMFADKFVLAGLGVSFISAGGALMSSTLKNENLRHSIRPLLYALGFAFAKLYNADGIPETIFEYATTTTACSLGAAAYFSSDDNMWKKTKKKLSEFGSMVKHFGTYTPRTPVPIPINETYRQTLKTEPTNQIQ